jgi:hypothetical protein
MLEVAAAITTMGVLDWVAIGATAMAEGVMPKPASTLTLSLTTSSCARRRVTSGKEVSSLTISCTFLPATVSPFCAIQRRAAASIWRPVVACWPVMGRMSPILNTLSCAKAGGASAAVAARARVVNWRRFIWGSPEVAVFRCGFLKQGWRTQQKLVCIRFQLSSGRVTMKTFPRAVALASALALGALALANQLHRGQLRLGLADGGAQVALGQA